MMLDDFRAEQRGRADAHLDAYLAGHPECAVEEGERRWLQGTHSVTFGSWRGEPAAFKFFDGDPRKEHEARALRSYAPTELVPRILDETDMMLVMDRLPDATMYDTENTLSPAERDALYEDLGRAVARVVAAAPGHDLVTQTTGPFRAADMENFYETPFVAIFEDLYRRADTATFFDTTLARAARVLADRPVPEGEALGRSLALLRRHRDVIAGYPGFVQIDDFHVHNIMAAGRRVTGFIDLEMTCAGNEPLLLGIALASMGPRPETWPPFRRGYEEARGMSMEGTLLELAKAAASFTAWIKFTWYWSTDDQPWWAEAINGKASAVRDIRDAMAMADTMEV